MTSVENLVKESFGGDCEIKIQSQFLSIYIKETKVAVINLLKHRVLLYSKDFLNSVEKFSEGYKQIDSEVEDFLVFRIYD